MAGFRLRLAALSVMLLPLVLLFRQLELCYSVNNEGRALLRFRELVEVDPYSSLANWNAVEEEDGSPCSWYGVDCENGRVVSLNLKDLYLKGILTPELRELVHLRNLILHNNSFYGIIPREIGELQKLEVLDLGCNNFSGSLPSDISNLISLKILNIENMTIRRLLVADYNKPLATQGAGQGEEGSSGGGGVGTNQKDPRTQPPAIMPPPNPVPATPSFAPSLGPSPLLPKNPTPFSTVPGSKKSNRCTYIYLLSGIGAGFFIIAAVCFIYYRVNKVVSVKPLEIGLSGHLQKAFITGVPVLKQAELEAACEDFSNIIGTLIDCTLYKGTLSSGVEIAVSSSAVDSAKNWSKNYEAQFRKKIATLSKVNHKNFVNLLGYCDEEEPFARMIVFEYAPNGTLFDHLHNAEDLDWAARLRIAMGIAYCVEHMHQLDPPVLLKKLDSNTIYLTDDYAAKISDFEFWSETTTADSVSGTSGSSVDHIPPQDITVHKFGIILLELMTGRHDSKDSGELLNWASDYLSGERPLKDMIDSRLNSFREEDVTAICYIIRSCVNPDPNERPSMKEVARRLREITSVRPEGARPKISLLWLADLEIISTDGT